MSFGNFPKYSLDKCTYVLFTFYLYLLSLKCLIEKYLKRYSFRVELETFLK